MPIILNHFAPAGHANHQLMNNRAKNIPPSSAKWDRISSGMIQLPENFMELKVRPAGNDSSILPKPEIRRQHAHVSHLFLSYAKRTLKWTGFSTSFKQTGHDVFFPRGTETVIT